jgi:hypothetical protein
VAGSSGWVTRFKRSDPNGILKALKRYHVIESLGWSGHESYIISARDRDSHDPRNPRSVKSKSYEAFHERTLPLG